MDVVEGVRDENENLALLTYSLLFGVRYKKSSLDIITVGERELRWLRWVRVGLVLFFCKT